MTVFSVILLLMVFVLNVFVKIAIFEELKRAKEKNPAKAVMFFLAQSLFLFFYTIIIMINIVLN